MNPTKRSWPEGVQCAVCLTFDLDAETMWTSRNEENWNRPVALSHGTYGPKVAMPKILELLRENGIKTTFFIPGWVVERNESLIKDIIDQGHEIGYHGYLHEWPDKLNPDQEEEILTKGIKIFEDIVGQRPLGYRSPAAEYSPVTLPLLNKLGYSYSSTMMDDVLPYKHIIDGVKTNLVELPAHWSIDDAAYFNYSLRPPISRMTITPGDFLEILKGGFMDFYRWGGCFTTFLHPQVIGRPGRFQALSEFIHFIKGLPQVWITRCIDVADYWQENCD